MQQRTLRRKLPRRRTRRRQNNHTIIKNQSDYGIIFGRPASHEEFWREGAFRRHEFLGVGGTEGGARGAQRHGQIDPALHPPRRRGLRRGTDRLSQRHPCGISGADAAFQSYGHRPRRLLQSRGQSREGAAGQAGADAVAHRGPGAEGGRTEWWTVEAGGPGQRAAAGARLSDPRRADQPPRPRDDRMVGGLSAAR